MIKAHPYADIFPLMQGEAFAGLLADIRANGLREPIIVHDGLILDGRNRYRACHEAGIAPITKPWDGRGDLLAFVISKNLHRRHLDESQRGMVAAKIATLRREDTLVPGNKSGTKILVPPIGGTRKSRTEAANMLNVGTTTVDRALAVQKQGIPELQEAVERGDVSLHAAEEVARKSQEEQKVIVSRGAKAIAAAAKAERESREDRRVRTARTRTLTRKDKRDPWPDARRQRRQMESEIWATLRDALIALTSLPLASDVAGIARANDKSKLVDARLSQSINWLEEFRNEWHRINGRDQSAA